jgi:Protein of unknown function (DUF3887)
MKTSILVALISSSLAAIALPATALAANTQGSVGAPAGAAQSGLLIAQASTPEAIAIEFVNDLSSGDYNAALSLYDSDLRPVIKLDSLIANWEDLTNELGALQNVSIRSRAASLANTPVDSSLVVLTCEFEGGRRDLFVVFTEDNEIVEYSVAESP